jgi:glycosyltransferase involved in cell wall biosynthesis
MRIALITDGIWPYVLGGMQKHSYYLCKYLAQSKVHIDLVHFNQSNYDISKLEFFSDEEKKYITPYVLEFPTSASFPGHYLYNSYRYSKQVVNLLKDNLQNYHLIYTKGFTGWHLVNLKSKKQISCAPVAVKFHGYEMFQKPPDLKTKLQHIFLLRKPVKSISKKADLVFSYGGKITDIIRSIGVEEKKIVVLPSGVERSAVASAFRPTQEKLKFLFLGRYERRKGIEELNQAIGSLTTHQVGKPFEFHFIGPIPQNKRLNVDSVIYHGEIRDKVALQRLMRQCDILVCPSWSEGMPNVILEAMANGLTVIATDVGATNVLLNDSTGWLLNSPAPTEIKSCLESVIKMNPDEINKKKEASLAHIRNEFTWEDLIQRFNKLLFS